MYRLLILSIVTIVLGCSTYSTAQADQRKNKQQVLVEELLSQVQDALIKVRDEADKADLPVLDSVQLDLSTQFSVDGTAKVSLFIISLGGGGGKESSQTLKLTLVPPKAGEISPASDNTISQGLADAILSAARAAKNARNRQPPLTLSELTASIKFVVKLEGSGGVKFVIAPVSVDLGGEVKSSEIQEITVTFKGKK